MSNEFDDTFDIEGQAAARAEAAKQREQYENQLDADYRTLAETHAGRRFLWDLLAPLWRISYSATRNDTDFREGERNVSLRVWARLIRVAPLLAHKLLEENQK